MIEDPEPVIGPLIVPVTSGLVTVMVSAELVPTLTGPARVRELAATVPPKVKLPLTLTWLSIVKLALLRMVVDPKMTFSGAPVPVAGAEMVTELAPELIETMVAPAGMLAPATTSPTYRPPVTEAANRRGVSDDPGLAGRGIDRQGAGTDGTNGRRGAARADDQRPIRQNQTGREVVGSGENQGATARLGDRPAGVCDRRGDRQSDRGGPVS